MTARMPCTIQRSTFQAAVDVSARWRYGSPAVSARPPQPHTHEQYHRLPKKNVSTGVTTASITTPQINMATPSVPSARSSAIFQGKNRS